MIVRVASSVGGVVLILVAAVCALASSAKLQALLLFLHWVRWPPCEYKAPERACEPRILRWLNRCVFRCCFKNAICFQGIKGAKSVSTLSTDDITLNGWFVPAAREESADDVLESGEQKTEGVSASQEGVDAGESNANRVEKHKKWTIIYYHGTAGTRAVEHRVALYEELRRLGFDVVAFDYRGYAENKGSPTETGVVEDARAVYEWVTGSEGLNRDPGHVIVWGHSLGTAISLQLVSHLSQQESNSLAPRGLVLESPFSSILDVVLFHAASVCGYKIPLLHPFLSSVGKRVIQFRFLSCDYIQSIRCPMLIMHGRHDDVIQHSQGMQMADLAKGKESVCPSLQFVTFENARHDDIVRQPEMREIVSEWFETVKMSKEFE